METKCSVECSVNDMSAVPHPISTWNSHINVHKSLKFNIVYQYASASENNKNIDLARESTLNC